jgi:calcineurin-like phosphoesterase family protein
VNGTKHLVLGNHDAAHPMHKRSHTQQRRFLEVFASVSLHEQHNLGGQIVNLSHLPYTGDHFPGDRFEQWRLRDEGRWLVCGHVHREWYQSGRQINVGVDWHPCPVPVGEIMQIVGGKV